MRRSECPNWSSLRSRAMPKEALIECHMLIQLRRKTGATKEAIGAPECAFTERQRTRICLQNQNGCRSFQVTISSVDRSLHRSFLPMEGTVRRIVLTRNECCLNGHPNRTDLQVLWMAESPGAPARSSQAWLWLRDGDSRLREAAANFTRHDPAYCSLNNSPSITAI